MRFLSPKTIEITLTRIYRTSGPPVKDRPRGSLVPRHILIVPRSAARRTPPGF